MASDPTFIGQIQAKQSKNGKKYYKGFLLNLPVVGFPKKDDSSKVFFKIDIQYLMKLSGAGGGSQTGSVAIPQQTQEEGGNVF